MAVVVLWVLTMGFGIGIIDRCCLVVIGGRMTLYRVKNPKNPRKSKPISKITHAKLISMKVVYQSATKRTSQAHLNIKELLQRCDFLSVILNCFLYDPVLKYQITTIPWDPCSGCLPCFNHVHDDVMRRKKMVIHYP